MPLLLLSFEGKHRPVESYRFLTHRCAKRTRLPLSCQRNNSRSENNIYVYALRKSGICCRAVESNAGPPRGAGRLGVGRDSGGSEVAEEALPGTQKIAAGDTHPLGHVFFSLLQVAPGVVGFFVPNLPVDL